MIQVVWFKKDLRVIDHKPLAEASKKGPVIALYVVEPEWWALPDMSARQWGFATECLSELEEDLNDLGLELTIRIGSVVDVLKELHKTYQIEGLYSHEETGNDWTYKRDIEVGRFCKEHQIQWLEYPQNGVVRRLNDRDGWADLWGDFMARPTVNLPLSIEGLADLKTEPLPSARELGLKNDRCLGRQKGGRGQALSLLDSFLESGRARTYNRDMSSPVTADTACSRLSAHLTWGSISMREVVQIARANANPNMTKGAYNAFIARLHWHCHFMQKLETSPEFEYDTIHPAYQTLRLDEHREDYFNAFVSAQTGFPFIDACLRYLDNNGWINFRMRAMLTSFAVYHLWLDWRKVGHFLARQFVDYEPGIHWNQIQMQSGTTGINVIRIYNPVKQSMDQDEEGDFIAQWVPELAEVPRDYIHEPWKMCFERQKEASCILGSDYPEPIIDHVIAGKEARTKIFSVRKMDGFRCEAQKIFEKHGSRKNQNRPKRRKRSSADKQQLDLF